MKLAARKTVSAGVQRRTQMQTARAAAPALRERFPQIGRLCIELDFAHPGGITPSPQQHTLHPAARAFFRFPCPCAECDGDFDLTNVVMAVLKQPEPRGRHATRMASGQLQCEGWHARDRATGRACTIELHYRLSMDGADES